MVQKNNVIRIEAKKMAKAGYGNSTGRNCRAELMEKRFCNILITIGWPLHAGVNCLLDGLACCGIQEFGYFELVMKILTAIIINDDVFHFQHGTNRCCCLVGIQSATADRAHPYIETPGRSSSGRSFL
jgi:hypothetical protein